MMDGRCNVGSPISDGNGRDGGGSGGGEGRYQFPSVDCARWDEATAKIAGASKWQGEAPRQVGSTLNTMGGPPRGAIMGSPGPGRPGTGQVPDRAFTSAGAGPHPNAGMHR